MAEERILTHPWLVAVWPGMGNVALNAGIYLLSKLDMTVIAELEASELFDIDYVEVEKGLLQTGRRPRNRFFVWTDPEKKHDLVIFLGEAQPPIGKYAFCRQLITYAKKSASSVFSRSRRWPRECIPSTTAGYSVRLRMWTASKN